MSRFGIRKKLKSALKRTILGESPDPPSSEPVSPTRSAAPAAPSEPAAPAPPASPRPAAPKPPPKMPPQASPAAPVEPDRTLGTSWVQAAGVRPDEVVPSTVHAVDVLGKRYALYKSDDGDFFATQDSCPHAGGPLAEGELNGFEVSCPFHSWTFDIRDGSCTSGQDLDVACIQVKVTDDMVMLEVPL